LAVRNRLDATPTQAGRNQILLKPQPVEDASHHVTGEAPTFVKLNG
jgi:hypothetical protein